MTYWQIPRIFGGRTVAILASGPSMSREVADQVRHLPRIVINNTWRLAPDADLLWASDAMWWACNADALTFRGIKATMESRPDLGANVPDAVMVAKNGEGGLDAGKCSGYAALQVALMAGASKVLLLGYDMHGGHWHGPHESPLGNPGNGLFRRWMADFASVRGDIVNCTPGSALKAFPMMALSDALRDHGIR